MNRYLVTVLGLAAILVCSMAVLTSASVVERPTVRSACPEEYGRAGGFGAGGWVPVAADVDGVDEVLVPGEPVAAMICAYPGTNMRRMGGESLAGSRVLADGVRRMARDLAYLPAFDDEGGGCSLMGGPMTNYLIRFDYADGDSLWLGSAEEVNSCVSTTNGTVSTRSYVGRSITAAYRTGTWAIEPPEDPCRGAGERRGQNEELVPGEPVSLLVCRQGAVDSVHARYGSGEARTFAALLNSLDTWPTEYGCHGGSGDSFRLMFAYSEGPAASVHITEGCDPSVSSPRLQADVDDAVRTELARLAPPK
ncbi:hypothetical protein Aph01nite_17480 [Acrocarpospora phusangensis]|uniref:Uncharacterized protein n=1 Tax=Acrocarpospora phusangensis TaxID=1070424 RepID=A0A919Q7K5_9ACTN|nr:hypothetical protein [Acrocarpospora phusangensis]GIH23438.1 hypothetical protein Aph01nite_17480 [Acrocarpospora phusangensis]